MRLRMLFFLLVVERHILGDRYGTTYFKIAPPNGLRFPAGTPQRPFSAHARGHEIVLSEHGSWASYFLVQTQEQSQLAMQPAVASRKNGKENLERIREPSHDPTMFH
jgi:hypothetical protein